MKILNSLNLPNDIKSLSIDQLKLLADEVRELILEVVKKNGGHLASSLGCVELIVALLSVFDANIDKIFFDVGHQAYAYKILTDRKDRFTSLRQYGGISGFPRPKESNFDHMNCGHAGNALALAIGYKVAARLKGQSFNCISVVGDGAFSSGMLHEALNNLDKKDKQIIIINDNGYAISPNEGGFCGYLKNLRENKICNPFELYGVDYVGVIDGHDIASLRKALFLAQTKTNSVIIHVLTSKGHGNANAEQNPIAYHNLSTGEKSISCSAIVGETLAEMAERDDRIIAVTPAMSEGTGLNKFQQKFPQRFFDTGITEQYSVSFSAGLIRQGFCVYLGIYSTFMQRGLDQLIHDVIIDSLPIKLLIDRSGIVFRDGETHAGVFDVGYLSLTGMIVFNPFDLSELKKTLQASISIDKPLAIRYSKEGFCSNVTFSDDVFCWENAVDGDKNIVLIPVGMNMVAECFKAKAQLTNDGVEVGIINAKTIQPIDYNYLSTLKGKLVVVVEDNFLNKGFGHEIQLLSDKYSYKARSLGLKDLPEFGDRENVLRSVGLDANAIAVAVKQFISK